MNPFLISAGAKAGSRAGSSIWKDKAGRVIILTGLAALGFFVVRQVGRVANTAGNIIETANSVIGVPKKFFEGLTSGWNEQHPSAEEKSNFSGLLNAIKINEKKLNYNPAAYLTTANSLYNAMNGWALEGGTMDKIEQALKGMNDDDFKATWVAFGLRKGTGVGQSYENLTQWLQDDLKDKNYNALRTRFKGSGLL